MKRSLYMPWLVAALCAIASQCLIQNANAQAKKPDILVIMGDDIGWYNTSIYNRGDMGYQTPNTTASARKAAFS